MQNILLAVKKLLTKKMRLDQSYRIIKPAVVAFAAKYSTNLDYIKAGHFPTIIGTGFVIDECGLILTNNHVVEAFEKLPKPPNSGKYEGVRGVLFRQTGDTVSTVPLEVMGTYTIGAYKPIDDFFDRNPPDLAVVGVNLKNLPSCNISLTSGGFHEGIKVATAGFPMGTSALMPRGHLQQLSPMLQQGIISSLQPYVVDWPVSFIINIMVQEGASGSPVFRIDTGEVIGVVFARMYQPDELIISTDSPDNLKDIGELNVKTKLPTNFSFVVPTNYLHSSLEGIKQHFKENSSNKQKTVERYIEEGDALDIKTGKIIPNEDLPNLNK